jgi:autotransporter-associated beta strand protein
MARLLQISRLVALLCVLLGSAAQSPAQTWDGGGANDNWDTANNWNPNGVPANDGTANLTFGGATRPTPDLNLNFDVNSLTFNNTAGAFTLGGSTLTVRGGGITNNDADTQTINHTLNVAANQTWNAAAGDLAVSGNVTGTGGITFTGGRTITLTGANDFSGATTVSDGTLAVQIPGSLSNTSFVTIGSGSGADNSAVIRLGAGDVIRDGATVSIRRSGRLDLNGFSDHVGALMMDGGNIVTGAGTLTIGGNISTHTFQTQAPSTISGNLDLGGVTRTVSVRETTVLGTELDISANITNGGLNFTNNGDARLSGNNTFAGGLTLSAEFTELALGSDTALGAGTVNLVTGIVQSEGGARTFSNDVNLGNMIGLGGSVTVAGPFDMTFTGTVNRSHSPIITISEPGTTLTISHLVASIGGFLTKRGAGTLSLTGTAANNSVVVNVDAGVLTLGKPAGVNAVDSHLRIGDFSGGDNADVARLLASEQIADSATVIIRGSGLFDLNGFSETISTLQYSGAGNVETGTGTLTITNRVVVDYTGGSTSTLAGHVDLGGGVRDFIASSPSGAPTLDVSAAISNGGIRIDGLSVRIQFSGNSPNTYAGTTTLDNFAQLFLSKADNVVAIAGDLDINRGSVVIETQNQVTSNTDVTLGTNGLLGVLADNTIGSLSITGSQLFAEGASTIVAVAGPIDTLASDEISGVTGDGALELASMAPTVTVADGPLPVDFDITVAVGGANGLSKLGTGTLQFAGTAANTYGGTTIVNAGTLSLMKSAGVTAVPGDLVIGDGTGGLSADVLRLEAEQQIADTAGVTVQSSGLLDLNGFSETVAGLSNHGTLPLGASTLVVAGGTFLNTGTATIAGGTLNCNTDGPCENNGDLVGNGSIGGIRRFRNFGEIDIDGGTLELNFIRHTENSGSISVGSHELNLPQPLDNFGLITLEGGMITGDGGVVNGPGGEIRGGSSVQSPLENTGGLIRATGSGILTIANLSENSNGGELRVDDGATLQVTNDFASDGTIVLAGPNATLSGGQITNTGTIRGQGRVNNVVDNQGGTGTIRAEGGTLTLTANHGDLEGFIEAGAGAEVLFTQGLDVNANEIILTGGGFDNNHHVLSNLGGITGFGTLRTGGLLNAFHRSISVGGALDVIGPVTNQGEVVTPTDTIIRFFGPVNGAGGYVGAGTVMFLDSFSPGESPAAVQFGGDLVLNPTGELVIELGGTAPGAAHDQILVAGDLKLGGTLAVELLNAFSPTVGQVFDILDWGRLSGAFDSIQLPPLAGSLAWSTSRLYTDGRLSVVLPGDFNTDGTVDAVDYIVWRNGLGTAFTQQDYGVWRANFGLTLASMVVNSQLSAPAMPEPSTWVLVLLSAAVASWRRRQRATWFNRFAVAIVHVAMLLSLFDSSAHADLFVPEYAMAEAGLVPDEIVLTNGQTIDIPVASEFAAALKNNGEVHGPTVEDEYLTFTDVVRGAGDYTGNIAFEGTFRPGNSPAVVQFGGNLSFGPASMLEIELEGTAIGEFDRFEVAGNLSLTGSLNVVLLNPFIPQPGDAFEIINVGSTRTGQFVGLGEGSLVGNFGGNDLFITYAGGDGNDVTLFTSATVPEARAWLMLGVVSVGIWCASFLRRRFAAHCGETFHVTIVN